VEALRIKKMSSFNSKKMKAKRGESLDVYGYIKSSLKNLAVGPRFEFRTMSGCARKCPVRPDNVRLRLSVVDGGYLG
jgi:hypothetical protein